MTKNEALHKTDMNILANVLATRYNEDNPSVFLNLADTLLRSADNAIAFDDIISITGGMKRDVMITVETKMV